MVYSWKYSWGIRSWAGHSARPSNCRSAPGPPSRLRATARSTYMQTRSDCRSEQLISTNVVFPGLPDPAPSQPALQHASNTPGWSDPAPALIPSRQAGTSFHPACQTTASSSGTARSLISVQASKDSSSPPLRRAARSVGEMEGWGQ